MLQSIASSLVFFIRPWRRLLNVARRLALLETHWRLSFLRSMVHFFKKK
jgi:hypothetical protein